MHIVTDATCPALLAVDVNIMQVTTAIPKTGYGSVFLGDEAPVMAVKAKFIDRFRKTLIG